MRKLYISVGDSVPTTGGVVVCSEFSGLVRCPKCFFCDYPCGGIACDPEERPDGKSVIFVEKKGGAE